MLDFLRTISESYKGQIRGILLYFMAPSMTTTERNALTNPQNGMIIHNTTTNKLNVRLNGAWEQITSA